MRRLLLAGLILIALPLARVGEEFGLALHAGSPAFAKEGGDGGSDGGGDGGSDGGSDGGGHGGGDGGSDGGSGSDDGGGGDDGSDDGEGSDDGDDSADDENDRDDDEQNQGSFGGTFGSGRAEHGGRDRDFRRGEIVGYGLTVEQSGALTSVGFRAINAYGLPALGQTITRIRVPLGLHAEEALAQAEALVPGAVLELNDLYFPEGAACATEGCWPADLVGFTPLDEDACTGAPPIAIIDTTVDRGHPALAGARIVSRSFVDDGARRAPADHATAISALLVGRPSGAARPLAPGGDLLVAEAFGREDAGERADAVAVLRGLDWAIASGAKVVGLSLTGAANRVLERGIKAAARKATLVAAAGNGGPDGAPAYPAAYPEVVAVAAVDARQRPYRQGTRGAYIDLSAPGVKIPSASPNGGTTAWTGTSFSVPFVMAALLRARAETGGDAAAALALVDRGTRDLGAPGPDDVYGLGLVQSPGDRCR